MKSFMQWYLKTSLVLRILSCFIIGSLLGGILWYISYATGRPVAESLIPYISPFGTLFVQMLKMIVIPIIFFSLVVGSASLSISRFGRVGLKTLGWYLFCSVLAAAAGVALALAFNPGSGTDLGDFDRIALSTAQQGEALVGQAGGENVLMQLLLNLFKNPFESLATGNFLPLIVFSILFGLAIRVSIESSHDEKSIARLESLEGLLVACRDAMFQLVDWILEYSPIGILALSIMNFGLYGPSIVGPYVSITIGVVLGILGMILVVYPILLWLLTHQNPFLILRRIQEAMIMAFITRSSAATLPVTIKVATEELKIRSELASFSLPLGATINMDGVCVHLPMFAVLAANMFGIELTGGGLIVLLLTTVLVSIGTGGVPGGSMMLLFIILETMHLTSEQIAIIVGLAIGIDSILDMFVTMNNVTGDLVCTYVVAYNENLIRDDESLEKCNSAE